MKKTFSTFAMMACLASSLAFAGDKNKPAKSSEDAKASTETGTEPQNNDTKGYSARDRKKAKNKTKNNAKPNPSDQEKEFDRVLRGIYG